MVWIERLDQTSWATLRHLRLAALIDAPNAFWATWEDENEYRADEWRRFARDVDWFAAHEASPVGLVGCRQRAECPGQIEVVGMWVHPDERGSGTADLLLDAACRWARCRGTRSMSLWVIGGNEPARRFFERHGFRCTGERAPLAIGHEGDEERMCRDLLAR